MPVALLSISVTPIRLPPPINRIGDGHMEYAMITTDALTRVYDDFVAVGKVSFTIDKGEIVGLLGHNGAGKTTIMKMMTGFLDPSSGTITIDGFNPEDSKATVHKKIGYLTENCPVYPEMRVIEYLDYVAALHAVPAE